MSLLMDLDILPTLPGSSKSNQSGRKCIPGDKLFATSEGQYRAGNGCYEFHGQIFASLAGYVYVFSKEEEGESVDIVEVRKKFDEKNHVLPTQGSIVTARVESITLKFAKCSIICVGDTLLGHEFNSTLRKEDVRDREKDKVEIFKFVQPGDIILARVLGYGDSQTAYLLSIAEEELGAISGRGQNGERLVPLTATVMKSINSEYRENRKVAMVPINAQIDQYMNNKSLPMDHNWFPGVPFFPPVATHFWTPPPPPPRPPPPPSNNTSWFTSSEIVPSCSWNTSFSTQSTSNHAQINSVSTSSSYQSTNSIHFLDSVNQQPFTPSVHYNTIYDNITSTRDRIEPRPKDYKLTGKRRNDFHISSEIHIDMASSKEDTDMRQFTSNFAAPLPPTPITRTIYNERARKKKEVPKEVKQRVPKPVIEEVAEEMCVHDVTSDGESDGEYPEMGRNWRCRSLFNARITSEALPLGCGRPQKEDDPKRNFPSTRTDFYEFDENGGDIESASKPTPSISSSHGYVLPNGNTWVRKKPAEESSDTQKTRGSNTWVKPQAPNEEPSSSSTLPKTTVKLNPSTNSSPVVNPKKRFSNNSLRIVNGKRIYAGMKDCFQFTAGKACLAGIFCQFEHNGGTDHQSTNVCSRLLRGQCRKSTSCPDGDHSVLLKHQYPVCDYFLRMSCIDDQCPYLHVKHTDSLDPCAEFNRGTCQNGVMCDMGPHRYYYSTIKEKSKSVDTISHSKSTSSLSEADPSSKQQPEVDSSTLRWMQ